LTRILNDQSKSNIQEIFTKHGHSCDSIKKNNYVLHFVAAFKCARIIAVRECFVGIFNIIVKIVPKTNIHLK